jgi:hypothetical protein
MDTININTDTIKKDTINFIKEVKTISLINTKFIKEHCMDNRKGHVYFLLFLDSINDFIEDAIYEKLERVK